MKTIVKIQLRLFFPQISTNLISKKSRSLFPTSFNEFKFQNCPGHLRRRTRRRLRLPHGRGKANNENLRQNSMITSTFPAPKELAGVKGAASPLACFLWFVSFARAKEMNRKTGVIPITPVTIK